MAGVAPVSEVPGFDEVTLDPLILPALSPVAAWHDCRHGRLSAAWRLEGATVTYDLTLPEGCAGLLLPDPGRGHHRIGGQTVALSDAGLHLPPGRHVITFDLTA